METLRHITDDLARNDVEAARHRHAIVPRTTLRRRTRLTAEEGERTARLARLLVLAEEVWEDRELAREFLLSSPPAGGEPPVDTRSGVAAPMSLTTSTSGSHGSSVEHPRPQSCPASSPSLLGTSPMTSIPAARLASIAQTMSP